MCLPKKGGEAGKEGPLLLVKVPLMTSWVGGFGSLGINRTPDPHTETTLLWR
jgi:hypothetical protein